jgi:hypothetical protein
MKLQNLLSGNIKNLFFKRFYLRKNKKSYLFKVYSLKIFSAFLRGGRARTTPAPEILF